MDDVNSQQHATPPKRARGRPRLHPIDPLKGTRPRGRPRIHPVDSPKSSRPSLPGAAKRPRGRPRKRQQDEIDEDDADFIEAKGVRSDHNDDEQPDEQHSRTRRRTRLSTSVTLASETPRKQDRRTPGAEGHSEPDSDGDRPSSRQRIRRATDSNAPRATLSNLPVVEPTFSDLDYDQDEAGVTAVVTTQDEHGKNRNNGSNNMNDNSRPPKHKTGRTIPSHTMHGRSDSRPGTASSSETFITEQQLLYFRAEVLAGLREVSQREDGLKRRIESQEGRICQIEKRLKNLEEFPELMVARARGVSYSAASASADGSPILGSLPQPPGPASPPCALPADDLAGGVSPKDEAQGRNCIQQ
ncbi:hypothetical protein Micbo1qcDRAFT_208928 [Microdochium bolleyi]|uniref:Uncharacterized protein n=1 Tax=Microdochium bolleyi TaxID=196109 RepID=A0A136INK6_9PEZI|nr:hypothetical protein Micbo1qcDRAFT_208928 [Microdochium bolleyi]